MMTIEKLQEELWQIENDIKQTTANLHAMQGAKQILEKLIAAENKEETTTE